MVKVITTVDELMSLTKWFVDKELEENMAFMFENNILFFDNLNVVINFSGKDYEEGKYTSLFNTVAERDMLVKSELYFKTLKNNLYEVRTKECYKNRAKYLNVAKYKINKNEELNIEVLKNRLDNEQRKKFKEAYNDVKHNNVDNNKYVELKLEQALLIEDARQKYMEQYCKSNVLINGIINLFFYYGNLAEEKAVAINKRDGTYKLMLVDNNDYSDLMLVPVKHNSPTDPFKVRGHFRRYKSGKVIWIDEFVKGKEKADIQTKSFKVQAQMMKEKYDEIER